MESRRIRQVIHPCNVFEGTGIPIRRSFPSYLLDYPDPFLLLDHFAWDDPAEYRSGFPLHPHRGIETVTYLLEGAMLSRDSLGNTSLIGSGEVGWLTAGSGALHEELPQAGDSSGRVEGFQLWINLPGYIKMSRPQERHIPAASIPQVRRGDGSLVKILCGEVDGEVGPVEGVASDPHLLDVSLPAGCYFSLPAPPGCTCLAYLYRGVAQFGPPPTEEEADAEIIPTMPLGYQVAGREPPDGLAAPRLVVFADGDRVEARSALGPARFLLLMGRPLHEPIARHGSIVMSTPEEIEETLRDYEHGMLFRPL